MQNFAILDWDYVHYATSAQPCTNMEENLAHLRLPDATICGDNFLSGPEAAYRRTRVDDFAHKFSIYWTNHYYRIDPKAGRAAHRQYKADRAQFSASESPSE